MDAERELPYAWVIVALAFLALALAMGIRSTIGLLVNPWEAEFGWNRAAVSLTASFGFLAYGLAQPLAGRWADRYGPRLVFAGSLALLGLSTVAVGLIRSLWQAYLVFGIGLMASVGGASNVPAAVAIARWIKRRKALAVGIVMSGAAAGQLVLVPAIATLIKASGWRMAFVWSGVGVLLIALPLVWFFLKDDPPGSAEARAARDIADGRPQPFGALARQKNFWWLVGSFWVCGVTTAGLIDTHLIPYAEDVHIETITAAAAFGVLGTFNVLGTLFAGAISDRWGHKWVLGWVYAGRALTLVFLLFVREPLMLFAFAVAFGLVDFATVPPTTALSTTLFGRRSGGTVIGLVSLSHQVGSAMGSYAGGLIHDVAGSYALFFLGGALLCAAAAAMSWAIVEHRAVEMVPSTT
ncbi:MAG: MFS transporter [Candidatus Rokubacteria bacterium]|nr:MFS transporter [Candidatus Rokubacteria bacterium]